MGLSAAIPIEINGWKVSGKDALFDRETLFDYIDGGAEVYLTYSFRQVSVRRFEKEQNPAITVEIFDMGKPEDALGIFSFEREGNDMGIGQGSEYSDGLLRFWKGNLFVSISSEEETEASRKTVLELGGEIERSISAAADPGSFASGGFLPRKGLLSGQVRFFHKSFNLNYHYFVADGNILHLDEETDAILAPYIIKKERFNLLAIRYPTPEKAKQGFESFMNAYMPEGKESGITLTENNSWTGAAFRKEYVVVVFDALSEKTAQNTIEKTLKNLEQMP
ncbi:MAG: DUF6599 family protein [Acidobacteriota bacterium]